MKEVRQFESLIADYYGARYAVAVDCCTHAIELCLRYLGEDNVSCPKHTYLSVPMTFEKLYLKWNFRNEAWENYYYITDKIIDAAVYWKESGYIPNTFMCLSFQYKKHLNLGRGGIILVDKDYHYVALKKMSYDGRLPDVLWANQNVSSLGYHYYMTPETAMLGMEKFYQVKDIEPKFWSYKDYPDISKMSVFNDTDK